MPRDKVGLVGRNGAGKTSLLKVLGGERRARRRAGASRKGGFGYLPQDPRIDRRRSTAAPRSPTCCRAAASTTTLMRIEKLRLAMEEDPTERNVARFSRAEERVPRRRRLRRRVRGARASPPASASPADRLDLPIGVLSGGERRRVELAAHPVRRQRRAAARRADQPPRRRRQGVAARLPAHLPRRAARHQPRPRPARRGDHPRAPPRPDEDAVGTLVEYKGTYSQYLAARAADEERLAKLAARQDKEIARLQTLVDRFGAKATQGGDGAQHREARSPASRPSASTARRATGRCSVRFPDPPHAGRHRARGRRALPRRYGGPPVFEDVAFDLGRGERLLVLGLNGAGKTQPAAHPRRRDRRRPRRRSRSATTSSLGYYAQEHDGLDRRTSRCSTTSATTCRPASC